MRDLLLFLLLALRNLRLFGPFFMVLNSCCYVEEVKRRSIIPLDKTHPQNLLSYKKILNRQSIDVFAVCDGYSEKNQYDSSLKIYCFEDWLKDNWNYFKTKDLKKYQDKYSKYCLWEIYYTDRYIRYKYSYEEAVLILIGLITFWENKLL